MNVDELVTAVKTCLVPSIDTCKKCVFASAGDACDDALFRALDVFAIEYKSQKVEIKKINEKIIDLRLENEDLQEEVEYLTDENDTLKLIIMRGAE